MVIKIEFTPLQTAKMCPFKKGFLNSILLFCSSLHTCTKLKASLPTITTFGRSGLKSLQIPSYLALAALGDLLAVLSACFTLPFLMMIQD